MGPSRGRVQVIAAFAAANRSPIAACFAVTNGAAVMWPVAIQSRPGSSFDRGACGHAHLVDRVTKFLKTPFPAGTLGPRSQIFPRHVLPCFRSLAGLVRVPSPAPLPCLRRIQKPPAGIPL